MLARPAKQETSPENMKKKEQPEQRPEVGT